MDIQIFDQEGKHKLSLNACPIDGEIYQVLMNPVITELKIKGIPYPIRSRGYNHEKRCVTVTVLDNGKQG